MRSGNSIRLHAPRLYGHKMKDDLCQGSQFCIIRKTLPEYAAEIEHILLSQEYADFEYKDLIEDVRKTRDMALDEITRLPLCDQWFATVRYKHEFLNVVTNPKAYCTQVDIVMTNNENDESYDDVSIAQYSNVEDSDSLSLIDASGACPLTDVIDEHNKVQLPPEIINRIQRLHNTTYLVLC